MRTAPCTWCLPSRCNRPPLWLFAFQKGHRTINQGCAGSVVLRHVCLFDNAWVIAHQASLSRGFSRKAYWSMLPCPSPRDLPHPGIKPTRETTQWLGGQLWWFWNNARRRMQDSCYFVPYHIPQTSSQIPHGRGHSCWDNSLLHSPLFWQMIKAIFLFPPNSVPAFLSGISGQWVKILAVTFSCQKNLKDGSLANSKFLF